MRCRYYVVSNHDGPTSRRVFFVPSTNLYISQENYAGMFADGGLVPYVTVGNYPSGTTIVCGSNGTAYAVKAELNGDTAYWCVDSVGTSKSVNGAIGTSVTVCP